MNKVKLMTILKLLAAPNKTLCGPIFLNNNIIIESIDIINDDNFTLHIFDKEDYYEVSSKLLTREDMNDLLESVIKILCIE